MRTIQIAFRSLLRLLANHCIIASLRIFLFKLSGVKIGKKAYVNMDVKFIDDWKWHQIVLEDGVAIASFVSLVAHSDSNNSFIGQQYEVERDTNVIIRQGAWLGTGAVVLHSIVGRGAIIASNAVVTKDVEEFSIMAGVPARKIGDVRERFKSKRL